MAMVHDLRRRWRHDGRGSSSAIATWAIPLQWAVFAYWLMHLAAASSTSPLPLPRTDCDPDTCVNGTCVYREDWQGTNSSRCIQSLACGNFTYGSHCEKCIPGYYGNPLNGTTCQPCSCNNHGTQCDSETGKCLCTTKGIIGDHCERCDVSGFYEGNPMNNGSCYFDLPVDYDFIFNFSKKEDLHYRAISFKNLPWNIHFDPKFSIRCSTPAKFNVVIEQWGTQQKLVLYGMNCTSCEFKRIFRMANHKFSLLGDTDLTTVYVHVYDFQPPFWIQISFLQYLKLSIMFYMVTSCLISMIGTMLLWKFKQKFYLCVRKQWIISKIKKELDAERDNDKLKSCKTDKDAPNPIALESNNEQKSCSAVVANKINPDKY